MIILHSFHKSYAIWHKDIAHLSRPPFSKGLQDKCKKEHFKMHKHTHCMWDKQVDTYIHGHTNRSFTSYFHTTPLKEGGNAIYCSRESGVCIKVQVTSTNVGYREWQKEKKKEKKNTFRFKTQATTKTCTQEVTLLVWTQRGQRKATVRVGGWSGGKDSIAL